MGLLQDSDVAEIRERLEGLTNPVKLVHFTQELNLEYGREARQLLEELAQISDKLSLETIRLSDRPRESDRICGG